MMLTLVLVINSDLSVTELMVTIWVVTESGMATGSSGPVEDVFRETCVSTVVPPVEPSHVDKFIPVVLGIRFGLVCGPVPMLPLGFDSWETEDTVPNDFLVPSGVPRWGLVPTSDWESETHSVVAVPFVGDLAGVMNPVGR